MIGEFSWFQPMPRNFSVDRKQLRAWRRLGKYYRKTREFKLLKQIEAERQMPSELTGAGTEAYWLLPHRSKLRRISSAGVIRYYMAFCPAEMIPICISLIGRCTNRFRLYSISEFCRHPSQQVRKHVAKALRRLEAWSLLDEMAAAFPDDEKIRWFANAAISHAPFETRLANFKRNVDDSHAGEVVTPSRMPFWAAERTWDYTPPKSVLLIRRMLQRIRHWVRWGVN